MQPTQRNSVEGHNAVAGAAGCPTTSQTVAAGQIQPSGDSKLVFRSGLGIGAGFGERQPSGPSGEKSGGQRSDRVSPAHRVNRILVVDDNDDTLQTVRLLLEVEGYDLQVAMNGPAALEIATWFVPEVVLLDIGLPGMDGFEVAARLLAQPELAHVILIALTGYGQPRDRERALASGFHQHLVKPVNPPALMQLLANL